MPIKVLPSDGPTVFMQKGYLLINGVIRNKEHPTTFEIPSQAEREGVKVGDYVKVGFERKKASVNALFGERLWIRITARRGRRIYGRINNDPLLPRLQDKMAIQCYPEHVLSILPSTIPKQRGAFEPSSNLRAVCGRCCKP